jgi:hypothetical protein
MTSPVAIRSVVVASVIVLSSSAAAWGQPKTDVVTLLNGDRFTGEIVELNRARLELKTDDVGTIEIEWDKIASLESKYLFEVETSSGLRLLGSPRPAIAQSLAIVTSDGVVTLQMFEITRITPIGTSFWKKLEGSIDVGFNYTHSSGIATTTFNSKTIFRRPDFVFRLNSSATLTQKNDDSERDDRGVVSLSYVRYRARRVYISGGGSFETNESLGLRLRSQLAGIVGMRLVNTNRAQFEMGGGLVVNDERGFEDEQTQNLEGVLGFSSSYYTYDRPKTQFDVSFQYFPSLSNWGRQRLQLDSDIRRELWRDFSVAVNVYYTFDSAPPNPDAERKDVGVVFSVGWTY